MSNDRLAFGPFLLEGSERRLSRDGVAVELSGRYLDALLLLARHPGELITKDRFMAEVWRGIPVTDEALTQCVRSLRKVLGDDVSRPRFIETVPRHGYRFVAAVAVAAEAEGRGAAAPEQGAAPHRRPPDVPPDQTRPIDAATNNGGMPSQNLKGDSGFNSPTAGTSVKSRRGGGSSGAHGVTGADAGRGSLVARVSGSAAGWIREWLLVTAVGLVGGAAAGLVGGVGYGLLAATDPPAGTGAISILLVISCLCLLIGLVGGLGVSAGLGLGRLLGPGRLFPVMAGGALGGLVTGSLGRLIGLDAFSLLIGSRPLAITGGSEGLLIGALAGVGLWWVERQVGAPTVRSAGAGGVLGAAAGLLISLSGGKMMAGSLAGLAAAHPDAPLGRLLSQLPPHWLIAAGALEGAIFLGALTLGFALALRGQRAP